MLLIARIRANIKLAELLLKNNIVPDNERWTRQSPGKEIKQKEGLSTARESRMFQPALTETVGKLIFTENKLSEKSSGCNPGIRFQA